MTSLSLQEEPEQGWLAKGSHAAHGSVDGIASNNCVTGKRDEIAAGPAGGLGRRIVRAEDLGAAREHGIPAPGVVGARFLGFGVGAGADEVAFLDQRGNLGGGTVVALDEGGVGLARLGIGKEDAPS